MEKRKYVKRLKGMLANRKEPCKCCPMGEYYTKICRPSESACKMCQGFNGLKFIGANQFVHKYGKRSTGCPCWRPGKLGAVTRALKKIEEYEAKYGEV